MKGIIIGASVCGALACGAMTNTVAELPTVVVLASRINQEADEMPSRVESYDQEALCASGAQSLADFLCRQAHLDLRTINANPMQTQVSLRGYGENGYGRCKILLDGEELNSVEMEAPNLMRVPLDQIERLEIVRGPQTVLHGDGASAGVINIVTQHASTPETRVTLKGGSEGTFGGGVSHAGSEAEEGLDYKAQYNYLRSDGYRRNSKWQAHTLSSGLRKTGENGAYVGLNANYTWSEYQLPGSLTEAQYKHDRKSSYSDDDWTYSHAYGVGLDSKIFVADETYLLTDVNFAQKNRHTKWGDYGYANDYALYSVLIRPRLVCEKPLLGHENRATVGVDGTWDHYDIWNGSAYMPPNPFFDRFRVAGYVHDEFYVCDELAVVAGLRGEELWNAWQRYDGLETPRDSNGLWAYEVGLVYRPVDDLKTYVKQTRFYRAPFCDEMNYVAPHTTLEPESGYSVDLGVDYAFLKEFNVFFDGYGTWTQDEIFYNPYHTPTAWGWSGYNCNSPSDTQRLGFDAGIGWSRRKFAHATVKCGFVDARFLSDSYKGNEVPLVPNTRVRLEGGYWLWRELEVRAGYRFVSDQRFGNDFNNEAGHLPNFSSFDLGVTYEPETPVLRGLRLNFTVDNLFDCRYCDYAGYSDYSGRYYYPAAGRTYLFTVAYTF